MSLPTPDQFRDLLRGLSRNGFLGFVVDLWTARGWAVEVEDDVVTATREGPIPDRRVVLVRHTAPRLRRGDWDVERDVTDVVTSAPATERARRFADGAGAALVDADDLREMALFAVDGSTREALFRTHFGRSDDSFEEPSELPPVGDVLSRSATPRTLAIVGLALLLVAAGVTAVPGLPGVGGTGASTADATPDGADTPGDDLRPGEGENPLIDGSTSAPATFSAGTRSTDRSSAPFVPRDQSLPPVDVRHGTGEHAWPMFGGGPTRAGRNAEFTGVRGGPARMAAADLNGPVISSPAVVNDTVYVGSLDGAVYALDPVTLERKWTTYVGEAVRSSPAVASGTVYIGGIGSADLRSNRRTYALGVTNGSVRWRVPTGSVAFSSPAVANGTVYVGSAGGTVFSFSAADGTVRWRADVGGSVGSSPAVANGTVYVGANDDRLHALDADTGERRWTFGTGGDVISSPAVEGGLVYAGSMDGNLYALDADTGERRWTFEAGESVFSSPAVANGTVYVGANDGRLHALDADTGERRWAFGTDDIVVSSPAVEGGLVYAGSMDGNLYALDADTGERRWTFETGAAIVSSPATVDGLVYVGSNDGRVYAIWARLVPNYPAG